MAHISFDASACRRLANRHVEALVARAETLANLYANVDGRPSDVRKLLVFREANVKFSHCRRTHATHRYTSFGLTPRAATERRSEGDRYTGDGHGTRGRRGMNGSDQAEVR